MLKILKEYGIERKIGYFTLDNASNNDTCMQELGLELNFNHKFRRLRCAGHMVNLLATQLLFGKESDIATTCNMTALPLGAWTSSNR